MSSNFQNKLLAYEQEPSSEVWEKIVSTLDQQNSPAFADKLFSYEQQPSAGIWELISDQLDSGNNDAIVVPFYKRYGRPLRYVGITAALILFAVMTTLLISNRTESGAPHQDMVRKTVSYPSSINQSNASSLTDKDKNETTGTAGGQTFNDDRSYTFRKVPFRYKTIQMASSVGITGHILPIAAHLQERSEYTPSDDKYMVYSDGNGHAFRLPKKLFDAVACPQEDLSCQERIRKLQEMMSTTPFSSDFSGIIEIIYHLKENQ